MLAVNVEKKLNLKQLNKFKKNIEKNLSVYILDCQTVLRLGKIKKCGNVQKFCSTNATIIVILYSSINYAFFHLHCTL